MKSPRFLQIRRAVAQVLNDCAPMLVPEDRLFTEANNNLRGLNAAATLAEFEQAIGTMEQDRHILRQRSDHEGVKTKLSELGEAELLK